METHKLRLGVINSWADKKSAIFHNKDGFLKMLQILRDRDGWDVTFFKKRDQTFDWEHDCVNIHFSPDPVKSLLDWNPDAVLFFSNFGDPYLLQIANKKPIAMCFTGGKYDDYAKVPDIVFTESKSYIPWMKSLGVNVTQAFGTNTELFKPWKQPKFFDALFPATFAGWKRHQLFAEAMKDKGLAVGWWQPNEMGCVETCFKNGTGVLHHQIAESMALLYSMAHTVVVTSEDIGGSQRTVLEALACNVPCIAMIDSTMTTEYIRESGFGSIVNPDPESIRKAVEEWKGKKVDSRKWIMENYSEIVYANKVRDGILSIL